MGVGIIWLPDRPVMTTTGPAVTADYNKRENDAYRYTPQCARSAQTTNVNGARRMAEEKAASAARHSPTGERFVTEWTKTGNVARDGNEPTGARPTIIYARRAGINNYAAAHRSRRGGPAENGRSSSSCAAARETLLCTHARKTSWPPSRGRLLLW